MVLLRHLGRLATIYFATLAAGFALFLVLIRSPFLKDMHVIFYRGIALAAITAIFLATVKMLAARFVRALDLSTCLGALALSLSFNICFLVLFPVTIDRSITIFLLSRIEKDDAHLTEYALRDRFIKEYLCDMRQIRRRVEEQALSGNVQVEQGRVVLTPQGRRFMAFSHVIADWFDTDRRIVEAPTRSPASTFHVVCPH